MDATTRNLWDDHAAWSQATFGSDAERGPTGPMRHLAKEAREVEADPSDASEHADCLLLFMDSCRRAGLSHDDTFAIVRAWWTITGGVNPLSWVVEAAAAKLAVNKARKWGKASATEPVFHTR